jgi:hypothetical protein
MIKFFRKIRQNLLSEGKTGKYFKYAIGEILLVVIGILIALQLNNWNDNNNKTKLGYQYLTQMKSELQDDVFKLDNFIIRLKKSLENQEAALNTNDIARLPIDSLEMILNSTNLDIKISELTYNKMNSLGITTLSNNESLNSKISEYYNRDVVYLKSAISYIFNDFVKRQNFYFYEQDKLDVIKISYGRREYLSMYKESEEESDTTLKSNIVEYVYSIKGRNIIMDDLNGKRYSLRVLNDFQKETTSLLKAVYDELRNYNPQIDPLPILPSEMEFKEITLSQDILKNYIGTYKGESYNIIVLIEDMRTYFEFPNGARQEIFPYEEDKFFQKSASLLIQFNKEKGEFSSFTANRNGKEEFVKLK